MRFSLTGLLLIVFSHVWSQNLVPNPSFEELVRCPTTFSSNRNEFIVPGWESPTRGTPDHFHGCSWGDVDVPFNWAGNSNANSGKGYVGVYVWNTRDEYREYLQCELAEPLVAGERYLLEFHYKLATNAVYAINRFGMTLSETRINVQHDQTLEIVPIISVELDSAITKATGTWEHIKQEYIAKGGERYVILGNFFNKEKTKFTRLPFRYGQNAMLNSHAYYYVDDVSVKNLDTLKNVIPDVKPVQLNTQSIELNKDYTLKDIKFEFDSYAIHPSSNDELNKVVTYLNDHPGVHCRLSGHTDFIGSDDYNVTLSRNRARSVADFLIKKGIQANRVVSFGFGKSRPLAPGKTDDDRKINRRVEIRFFVE